MTPFWFPYSNPSITIYYKIPLDDIVCRWISRIPKMDSWIRNILGGAGTLDIAYDVILDDAVISGMDVNCSRVIIRSQMVCSCEFQEAFLNSDSSCLCCHYGAFNELLIAVDDMQISEPRVIGRFISVHLNGRPANLPYGHIHYGCILPVCSGSEAENLHDNGGRTHLVAKNYDIIPIAGRTVYKHIVYGHNQSVSVVQIIGSRSNHYLVSSHLVGKCRHKAAETIHIYYPAKNSRDGVNGRDIAEGVRIRAGLRPKVNRVHYDVSDVVTGIGSDGERLAAPAVHGHGPGW